ncbi:IS1595 family transposase [Ferruginibacter albus]|uniref:IS1595 family transposase n=1 Tax=Ferruginibacter albus TaxID=2875540 RepID=UPI001CC47FC0|nr:IS1595 family transposase [Ferruginibacter albus]UAY53431.1 IS1595 family transposase [Ferruginibacter albus]
MVQIKLLTDFDNLFEIAEHFRDEATCLKYLEYYYWNNGVRCPHCNCSKIYRCKTRLKCSKCKVYFSLKHGTMFAHSAIPLKKWFMAMYLIGVNNGISSVKLGKMIKIRQATAWFMLHRIRGLLNQNDVQLEGIVSSDETFVGGKNKNRHVDKKVDYSDRVSRDFPDKVPVLGMMEKGGNVKTVVIENTLGSSILPIIKKTIKEGSRWVTDNYFDARKLNNRYKREVTNHHLYQYKSKRGYSTNNIENFWSLLKRMIIGVYHNVSKKHLQRYCDELAFRFNARHLHAGERLNLMFSKLHLRLNYKQLTK